MVLLRIGAAAALLISAGATAPATATDLGETRYRYDFYVGGMRIARAQLQTMLSDSAYRVTSELRTTGLLGWMFETHVATTADGSREGSSFLSPAVFETRFRTEKKQQSVRMEFEDDAPRRVSAEPPFRRKSYEIDPSEQRGALDPQTAILAAFLPDSVDNVCNRMIPIFDGRHRFNVVFHREARRVVESGETLVDCDARYERVAGYKPKTMRKARSFPFKVRFALGSSGGVLPIRIWGETNFGAAVGVLRR